MKYYELRDNIYYPERWYLGDIIEAEDNWEFIYGKKVDEKSLPNELHIEVYKDGTPMDYTTTEGYNVPIVSQKTKEQLGGICGLQFLPIIIKGKITDLKYFIMVATDKFDCVNEELSVFEKFVENDPIRPDLAGQYSWFTKLVIDPSKVNGADIFRVSKTGTYLIVSERVKQAMEDVDIVGAKFTEV